jgi:hypothetical protein
LKKIRLLLIAGALLLVVTFHIGIFGVRKSVDIVAEAVPMCSDGTTEGVIVWAVNDGEKIKRDDLTNPNRYSNSVWDGNKVTIFGGRNEVVAFQLMIQADPQGAEDINVELEELTHSSGATLRSVPYDQIPEDPTNTIDREIELFTEHYLNIENPTWPSNYYVPEAAPNMTGWIPDALIPFNALESKGGAPFDIGACQNQGVWVDIYIPKMNTPAGFYNGTIKVSQGASIVNEIPITLRVLDYTLPDESHFKSMIIFDSTIVPIWQGEGDSEGEESIKRYHRLAHRHRVEFVDDVPFSEGVNGWKPNPDDWLMEVILGDAFSYAAGYDGPAEAMGNTIIPPALYSDVTTRERWEPDNAWQTADNFVNWINFVKPNALTPLHIIDEPSEDQFPWIINYTAHLRNNPGPGASLPNVITKRPDEQLVDIDTWITVANGLNLKKKIEEEAAGRSWWFYNGRRPWSGALITDAPAVDPRTIAWAGWKHDVDLWLYWNGAQWGWGNYRVVPVKRGPKSLYEDPATYYVKAVFDGSSTPPDYCLEDQAPVYYCPVNGDGVLIYLGKIGVGFTEQNRGIRGPVASIRLKNLRRGSQDYELLWLAQHNGLGSSAQAAADLMVPKVFSDIPEHSPEPVSWSEQGSDWDEARYDLAVQLTGKLVNVAKAKLTFFYNNYVNSDRLTIMGELEPELDMLPFEKELTVTIEAPDPYDPYNTLLIYAETIPAGASVTSSGASRYVYKTSTPGIQELRFEERADSTLFRVSADEANFLPAERQSIGNPDQYQQLIRDIESLTITIDFDDGILWRGTAALTPDTTTDEKQELNNK